MTHFSQRWVGAVICQQLTLLLAAGWGKCPEPKPHTEAPCLQAESVPQAVGCWLLHWTILEPTEVMKSVAQVCHHILCQVE